MRFAMVKKLAALVLGGLGSMALAAAPEKLPAPAPAAPVTTTIVSDAACHGDGCCPTVDCCKEEKCSCCCFIGGFTAYWLKAYPANDTAYQTERLSVTTDGSGFDSFSSALTTTQFDRKYNFAPSVFVGMSTDGGLGFGVRWFRFVDETSLAIVNGPIPAVGANGGLVEQNVFNPPIFGQNVFGGIPAGGVPGFGFPGSGLGFFSFADQGDLTDGDRITISNRIRLSVYDAVVTQQLNTGSFAILLSGGARWAMLSQSYRAQAIGNDEGTPGNFFVPGGPVGGGIPGIILENRQTVIANNTFNGIGPTLGLDMRWGLGDTGIALYGLARGAVLFGKSTQFAAARSTFITDLTGVGSDVLTTYSSSQDRVMPVVELEGGVQWSKTTGPIRPLLRVGATSMTWFDAGSSTSTDGNLGLFGLAGTVGFTY